MQSINDNSKVRRRSPYPVGTTNIKVYDGANDAGFGVGEPATGGEAKDGISDELGGGAESLTGSE